MKSVYQRNVEKFQELSQEARWAAECWHADCVALGRPFTVSEVFRTVERQKALYAQGRTKPGPIVTERDGVKKLSEHQTRLAADIYPNCSKRYQTEWYQDIEDVGRKYGINHPYTKGRFIDLPHFTFEDAKKRPEPRMSYPATIKVAIRKVQRQLDSMKPGTRYERLRARLEELKRQDAN